MRKKMKWGKFWLPTDIESGKPGIVEVDEKKALKTALEALLNEEPDSRRKALDLLHEIKMGGIQ